MSELAALMAVDENVRKYFDFIEVPELNNTNTVSAFKDKRDGNIKYVRLNKIFIKCDHPKVSITANKNKNGNFDMSISQKGDYCPHISIDVTTDQTPITLSIDEDTIHGIFLSVDTYVPLFNPEFKTSVDEIIDL